MLQTKKKGNPDINSKAPNRNATSHPCWKICLQYGLQSCAAERGWSELKSELTNTWPRLEIKMKFPSQEKPQ